MEFYHFRRAFEQPLESSIRSGLISKVLLLEVSETKRPIYVRPMHPLLEVASRSQAEQFPQEEDKDAITTFVTAR